MLCYFNFRKKCVPLSRTFGRAVTGLGTIVSWLLIMTVAKDRWIAVPGGRWNRLSEENVSFCQIKCIKSSKKGRRLSMAKDPTDTAQQRWCCFRKT